MSKLEGGYFYYSILVVSSFVCSVALESSSVLLSYSVISLASHMTMILKSTLI